MGKCVWTVAAAGLLAWNCSDPNPSPTMMVASGGGEGGEETTAVAGESHTIAGGAGGVSAAGAATSGTAGVPTEGGSGGATPDCGAGEAGGAGGESFALCSPPSEDGRGHACGGVCDWGADGPFGSSNEKCTCGPVLLFKRPAFTSVYPAKPGTDCDGRGSLETFDFSGGLSDWCVKVSSPFPGMRFSVDGRVSVASCVVASTTQGDEMVDVFGAGPAWVHVEGATPTACGCPLTCP